MPHVRQPRNKSLYTNFVSDGHGMRGFIRIFFSEVSYRSAEYSRILCKDMD